MSSQYKIFKETIISGSVTETFTELMNASATTLTLSGVTAGSISGTTFYGDASNLTNIPPRSINNLVVVSTNPGAGEFSSIYSAVTSITGASASNRYVVKVNPGIYTEPEITVPSWVYIVGESIESVTIKPDAPTHNVVNMSPNSQLNFLTISGAGTNYIGVNMVDSDDFTLLFKISIVDCYYGLNFNASTIDSYNYCEYVDVNYCEYPVKITSNNNFLCFVNLENFYIYNDSNSNSQIVLSGDGAFLTYQLGSIIMETTVSGIGIEVNDFGHADVTTVDFDNLDNAILIDGQNARGDLSNLSFDGCNLDINVTSPTASGDYSGYVEYLKQYINPSSTFFIANKNPNIITVGFKGADFTSINSAITSITGNSSTNRYTISVAPGIYNEPTITCKPYVSIVGESQFNTIVNSVSGDTVFIGSPNAELKLLQIGGSTGSGSTDSAIVYYGGGTFRINDVRMNNNKRHIFVNSTTGPAVIISSTLSLDAVSDFNNFLTINDNGVNSSDVVINSFNHGNAIPITGNTSFFDVTGTKSRLTLYNTLAGNPTAPISGNFLKLSNGGDAILQNVVAYAYDTFCYIDNVGLAPDIKTLSTTAIACTNDFNILNANTTGSIFGGFNRDKISIAAGAKLAILFNDSTNSGVVLTGDLYQGGSWNENTNITNSINYATNIGVNNTPTLTYSGFNLTSLSGTGYVSLGTPPDEYIKQVIWSSQTISLSANTFYYIYVDSDGVVHETTSEPSYLSNIILGKVRTNGSGVVYLQDDYRDGVFTSNKLDEAWRKGLGNIFNSGCIVSENVTPFKLDISSGSYWYSTHNFTPSATTSASFYSFYKNGVGGWNIQTGNTVETKYDSMTGSTISLSAGSYTKHAFYVVNDGADQKYLLVYGQETFPSQLDAENGALPTQPSFFVGNVAPIAGIVVAGSATGITSVTDIRPTLAFKAESASASSVHGNLLGLDADDHTQYLLVNGTRSMSGNLNMDSNNIINVGTVNSVTIEDHSSRHLPNGADALPIGNPVAIGLALFSGTSNTFAMADHVHTVDYTNVGGLVTQLNNKASLSGATFTGVVKAPTLSGTSVIGTTIFGNNITATGTIKAPTLSGGTSILGANITATGTIKAPILSATTYQGNVITSATTVGSGIGIFKQKSGNNLQFRSIVAGTNITITTGDTLTISSTASGGSSRITGATTTTNATPAIVDTIDTMLDNATNLIEVYVKAYQSGGAQWGVWKRTLTVTKVSGTVTIREENADVDKQSTGLKATSVSFSVSGGNINVNVTGIAATTITWKSAYEIIL